MAITAIKNQAVKLYTTEEVRFNEKNSHCQYHLDYYNLATCDDISEVLVETTDDAVEVQNDGEFTYRVDGSNTSITANKLVDSGADFIADAVLVGMIVRNENSGVSAKITNIDNLTTLSLDADIFTSSPVNYSITHYVISGGMAIIPNTMVKTTGTSGYFKQEILTEGLFYKVSIDITYFESFLAGSQIKFKIGGNEVWVLDETNNPSGTVVFYGVATGTEPLFVEVFCDSLLDVTFANFIVVYSSNVVFFILKCDDNSIVYSSLLEDVVMSSSSNQVKLRVNWAETIVGGVCNGGCYYIGGISDVSNPLNLVEDRISNGIFTDATDWSPSIEWTIGSGIATLNTTKLDSYLWQFNLAHPFYEGLSYNISFDVLNYFNGGIVVEIYDAAYNPIYTSALVDTYGSYTFSTGILPINCTYISFYNTIASTWLSIDNVSAIIDAENSLSLRSDCFEVAESHDCTVKLSGLNYDNAFGIDFNGLNYNPMVRVQGELRTPTYDDSIDSEEDSEGTNSLIYFNSDKQYTLHLYDIPEHLHDFVRLLRGYDDFRVNDIQYIPKGDYKPEWVIKKNKVFDLAKVNFTVKEITELNKNKYC